MKELKLEGLNKILKVRYLLSSRELLKIRSI